VLVGLTRGAARVAQKDICMEEMMVVVGLNRARIRLGKWVHLKFHFMAEPSSRVGARRRKQPAGILLTTDHRRPFFVVGTIN
jgi:hypothetical protein